MDGILVSGELDEGGDGLTIEANLFMVHGLAHSLGECMHLCLDESWGSLIILKFGDDIDTFVDSSNGITKFEVISFE